MSTPSNAPDILLDIALGRSRKETYWKNTQMLWTDILRRVSKTHRTAETYADYLDLPRDRQDEIKDVGGFVGGLLTGGQRKPGSVMHRSLLTLDMDTAKPDAWETYGLLYDYAACIYSTHKHSPEKPRYRLLIPLDRPVNSTEYEAIGRRIAGKMGIEMFDDSGFQPYRLMYWPSTAADGVFEYHNQPGPFLPVDKVLSTYRDYTDASQWPVSRKVGVRMRREITKQGDPLEKRGVIGAFCRCYSISEVIEKYLPQVYEPVIDGQGQRYTYALGSTAGGLVVYDDKYAYSHHGTDPISGKLCNAFDLVRLHLFGMRDEDTRPGTAVTKLPSYRACVDLVLTDENVKIQIGTEKMQAAAVEFAEADAATDDAGAAQVLSVIDQLNRSDLGLPSPPEPLTGEVATQWLSQMNIDGRGQYLSTFNNITLVLTHDNAIRGRVAFNEFLNSPVVLGSLPWQPLTADHPAGRQFNDRDAAELRGYLETVYGITGVAKVRDALLAVWSRNGFHPVRKYLQSLPPWDRVPRLEAVLPDYFGAHACDFTATVARKWFTAAVARVMQPGIKFDYTLTLTGAEGTYKSTFFRKLAEPWFTDNFSFHMLGTTRAAEQLPGHWIIEIGELTGLKYAELEGIKAFLSRQEDTQRGAFKEFRQTVPRQSVFAASTNIDAFLRGSSGNRRFWVVRTKVQPVRRMIGELDQDRGQLWAEALHYYHAGETLYLSESMEAVARQVQDEHTEVDDRYEAVKAYLDILLPDGWQKMSLYERRGFLAGDAALVEGRHLRETVSVAEIWTECLGSQYRDMNQANTKPLHDIMRRMQGWREAVGRKRLRSYGLQKHYERVSSDVSTEIS